MLILGATMHAFANPDGYLVRTMASYMQVLEWTEFLDWTITPKLSDEFNYHTAITRKGGVMLYTRSATAMIRGLRKLASMDEARRVYTTSGECLGIGYGAFKLSGFTKTKVGGALGVVGHNVKQFFVRGFVKAIGNTGDKVFKARKAMAGGDEWDEMTVALKRKKWFKKLNSNFGGVVDRYQSFDAIEGSMNPFSQGFAVYIAHSSQLPVRVHHGGVIRTISPELKYGEIASHLESNKAELSAIYKH